VDKLKGIYAKLTEWEVETVRLFYGGVELKNEAVLAESKLISDVVVQAMIRKKNPETN
jgi:hypothetical protein